MKISEMNAATAATATNRVAVVQSATTKQATLSDLQSATNVAQRWRLISSSRYTATPASTSTITCSETEDFAVGLPVKYTYDGTTYYGVVKTVTNDTSIAIQGAPLNTGKNLTALHVGPAEAVVRWHQIYCYSNTGGGDLDIEKYTKNYWQGPAAHLVFFRAYYLAGSVVSVAKLNVAVDGNYVSTNDSNYGIQPNVVSSWFDNPDVAVNVSNYRAERGDRVSVGNTTGSTASRQYAVELMFVLE